MWYSPNSTSLGHTVNYHIGREQIEKINLKITPQRIIKKDYNVSSSILGIPFAWNDVIDKKLLIHATDDFNVEYKCPTASKFENTKIVFNLNMQFVENQFILQYYSFNDVFSTLGGLLSSIGLIVSQFQPLIVIYFLFLVANMIKRKMKKDLLERQNKFLMDTRNLF